MVLNTTLYFKYNYIHYMFQPTIRPPSGKTHMKYANEGNMRMRRPPSLTYINRIHF
jgi:hypothetical protein